MFEGGEISEKDVYRWTVEEDQSSFAAITCYVEGVSLGNKVLWWRLRDPSGRLVDQDEIKICVEEIVWPSNETGSGWEDQPTSEWDGFKLNDGWYIEKSLEELIESPGEHGFIRTHYPVLMVDETLESNPDDPAEAEYYVGRMGFDHGSQPAISTKEYANGFTMNLTFEFDGPEYVEAFWRYVYSVGKNDESPSFFRNSGVYVYDHYEIQIYDTDALLKALDSPDFATYSVDVDGANRGIRADINSGQVNLYHELNQDQTPKYWDGKEPVNGCISGIPYKQGGDTTLAQLQTAAERIDATGTNTMTINVTPDNPKNLAQGVTMLVSLNGHQTFSEHLNSKTGDGLYKDKADTFVHLQSHWGSGVKFVSATITPNT